MGRSSPGKSNDRARSEQLHTLRLMDALAESERTTQRELSRRAGISLGLTNLLLERMARKAWVKLTSISGRRMIYALTPKGMAEKARKTRDWVRHTYRYFSETRAFLVAELHKRNGSRARGPSVACYGALEMVELVRDAAKEAGGRLVGVVDDDPAAQGHTVSGFRVWGLDRLSRLKCEHVVLIKPPPRGVMAVLRKKVDSIIDLT